LQELAHHTPEDEEVIDAVLDAMKGGAEAEYQRGTLLNYIVALAHPRVLDPIGKSCSSSPHSFPFLLTP